MLCLSHSMKQSLFIECIGDSATTRVLDYLLTERDLDFSISDLSRNTGMGRATLYRIWDNLVRNRMVIYTRTIGKSKLYKLNKKNIVVKKLIQIDNALMMKDLRKRNNTLRLKV